MCAEQGQVPRTFLFPPSARARTGLDREGPPSPAASSVPAAWSPRVRLCKAGGACRGFCSRHNTTPNTAEGRVRSGSRAREDLRDALVGDARDRSDGAGAHPFLRRCADRLVALVLAHGEVVEGALVRLDLRREAVHLAVGDAASGLRVASCGGADTLALLLVGGDALEGAAHTGIERGKVGLALLVGEGERAGEVLHASTVLDTTGTVKRTRQWG